MKRLIATTTLVLVLPANIALAQAVQNVVLRNSFNPVGAGARGLGMGGAFIAVADDGTAASFNPAGLSQLRRTEFAFVGFMDTLNSTITIPGQGGGPDTQTSTSNRHKAPDFGSVAIPFEVGGKNLTVQASYQRSVDLFGKGSDTISQSIPLSKFRPMAPPTAIVEITANVNPNQSGAFHTVSLSAGYQVTSRLSLGLSLNYWLGNWTAQGINSVGLRGLQGNRTADFSTTQFHQVQSMRAFNVNAGLLLRYPKISLGGIVRFPFVADYSLNEDDTSTAFFDANLNPQTPVVTPQSFSVTSQLHWPLSLGGGIALRPFHGLTLAGDYSRSHWSRTFIEDVPAGALLTPVTSSQDSFSNLNFFDLLPQSGTTTVDTEQWRGGGEYLVTLPKVIIPLRGGAFRDHSPISELGTNQGKLIKGFTIGTGLNFSRLVLDVAFERRTSEGIVSFRVNRGEIVAPEIASRESVKEDRIVAAIIYRFGGEDDPIKRAIKYLFVGSEGNN